MKRGKDGAEETTSDEISSSSTQSSQLICHSSQVIWTSKSSPLDKIPVISYQDIINYSRDEIFNLHNCRFQLTKEEYEHFNIKVMNWWSVYQGQKPT